MDEKLFQDESEGKQMQNQDLQLNRPDFKSPVSFLQFAGEAFYDLFNQTRNEKAVIRARLLNSFIDGWSKIYRQYADTESLSELKARIESLETEKGLKIVSR